MFWRFPSEVSAGANYCAWACRKAAWSRMSTGGVYTITHARSGRVYVGSSVLISRRWNTHRWLLRRGQHPNIHLQRAWTRYGESAFDWAIVEPLDAGADLAAAEQMWIDRQRATNPDGVFNFLPTAGSRLGSKHSDETRARIAAAQRGRTHTAETLARMKARVGTAQAVAKLNEANVAVIKARLASGCPQRVLAADYGVSRSAIGEIARGANWSHVQPAVLP